MPENQLETKVRRISPFANVIDIHGQIDMTADHILSEAFAQATQDNFRTVIFNFADMSYMNSIGIGLLIMLVVRGQRQGIKIAACGLNEHYQNIFRLTRLEQVIPNFTSEEIALSFLEPFDLPEREY